MKIKYITFLLLSACLLLATVSFAQQPPLTTDQIMTAAKTEAKAEKKNVFVIFHASWCGWCKKMDASMQDPASKQYFDDNFVITHITVLETGDKVALDNPGGQKMLEEYGGGESGIPYWLIFDADGNLLADSKTRKPGQTQEEGQNLGCPATEPEIKDFIAKLQKTSTITDQQAEAVMARFLKNAPAND